MKQGIQNHWNTYEEGRCCVMSVVWGFSKLKILLPMERITGKIKSTLASGAGELQGGFGVSVRQKAYIIRSNLGQCWWVVDKQWVGSGSVWVRPASKCIDKSHSHCKVKMGQPIHITSGSAGLDWQVGSRISPSTELRLSNSSLLVMGQIFKPKCSPHAWD